MQPDLPVASFSQPLRYPARRGSVLPFFLLALLIIGLDQLSKYLVHKHMQPGLAGEIPLLGNWFKLHYTLNPGMAFGVELLPPPYGKLLLTAFRILAAGGISYYMVYLWRQRHARKALLRTTNQAATFLIQAVRKATRTASTWVDQCMTY